MRRSLTGKPKTKGSAKRKVIPPKRTPSGSDDAKEILKLRKPGKSVDRRKVALRRLGVTELQVKATPDISTLLKQAKGGLTATLEAMRFSRDLNVITFLEKYDEIPERDRKSLPWEAIAVAASVEPTYLLGGAILALQAYSANIVKIIALSHHPEMISKRVEFGRLPGGGRDRDALDTALGFLPTPKGSTFIINPGSKPE
ncbi:MAG TPA: hypothetical protein VK638_40660, partial [Edaphobacter sp.]|nr:hypothetical protein [Edaphobacter sp.]